jgi:hypothetical protein
VLNNLPPFFIIFVAVSATLPPLSTFSAALPVLYRHFLFFPPLQVLFQYFASTLISFLSF